MDLSRVNRSNNFPYGYDNFKKELNDGINAINKLKLWDWLKNYDLDSDLFGAHENSLKMDGELEYLDGHSGGSHTFMMRSLIYIAKYGFDDFVLYMNASNGPPQRPPTPQVPRIVPIHNRADTGGAELTNDSDPLVFFRQSNGESR